MIKERNIVFHLEAYKLKLIINQKGEYYEKSDSDHCNNHFANIVAFH